MYTTFGAIEIDEQTYWDRHHQREVRPVSSVCALRSHGYSQRLQRVITDFAADTSFERASAKVKEHYDLVVPVSSCRAIALKHASNIDRQYLPQPPAKVADVLIVEADGSMVPIVSIDEAAGGDHRKRRTLSWKEAKLSLVHCAGEQTTLVGATFGNPQSCGKQMYGLAESAGLGKATRVHAVGDGAPWIADQVETLFGRQGRYLVDFFHVCEYLAPVGAYTKDTSGNWLEIQKDRLRNNELPAVLTELECWFEPLGTADTPARDGHRYLSARSGQMDYQNAIGQNLPIGSGEIESANRSIVQARLKRPGAWWKINNAQSMIDLQSLRHNGRWESYWDNFRQAA
jgi:hypothetical protein